MFGLPAEPIPHPSDKKRLQAPTDKNTPDGHIGCYVPFRADFRRVETTNEERNIALRRNRFFLLR